MQTIIISTDFSPASLHAAEIAARIASFSKARLIIYHAYTIPAGLLEAIMVKAAYDEASSKSHTEMNELVRHLRQHNPADLQIETVCTMGSVAEELSDLISERQADLIVTGTSVLGRWEEVLIGNTATEIVRNLDVPLLAIPETTASFPPKTIALACTRASVISEQAVMMLMQFEKIFGARLLLVHVVKCHENQGQSALPDLHQIQQMFGKANARMYLVEDEQTNTGLKKFIEQHEVDWLVMFPEEHDMAERLFLEIHTRNMLVSSHVPILAFPAARS